MLIFSLLQHWKKRGSTEEIFLFWFQATAEYFWTLKRADHRCVSRFYFFRKTCFDFAGCMNKKMPEKKGAFAPYYFSLFQFEIWWKSGWLFLIFLLRCNVWYFFVSCWIKVYYVMLRFYVFLCAGSGEFIARNYRLQILFLFCLFDIVVAVVCRTFGQWLPDVLFCGRVKKFFIRHLH